ncbi:hypothetical protein BHE74_00021487 [Ensete ventricosum]|nr:hypothetical protein BHE74_00021487 [Ensete ventricosum]
MAALLLSSGGFLNRSVGQSCRRPEPSCLGSAESLRRSILDKSPTACRRGRCTPVDYCVCLGTSSVAICQGLGGTVRRSAAASTMTRHLSPAVGGQGVSFACRLLRLPWHTARCQLSGVMGLV